MKYHCLKEVADREVNCQVADGEKNCPLLHRDAPAREKMCPLEAAWFGLIGGCEYGKSYYAGKWVSEVHDELREKWKCRQKGNRGIHEASVMFADCCFYETKAKCWKHYDKMFARLIKHQLMISRLPG